jgi:hypothetical protein
MDKCIFCSKQHNRTYYNTQKPAKYCSTKCIKRAFYLKSNPNRKSFLRGDAGFWESETGIGFFWEQYVAKKLKGEHMPFNKLGIDVASPIGNIDVKVCNKYHSQWVFNKNNAKPIIDWYYCICLEDGNILKELLIPTNKFIGNGMTVGKVSKKYDRYKV